MAVNKVSELLGSIRNNLKFLEEHLVAEHVSTYEVWAVSNIRERLELLEENRKARQRTEAHNERD